MIDLKRLKSGAIYTKPNWVGKYGTLTLSFSNGKYILNDCSPNAAGYSVTHSLWEGATELMEEDWYEVKNHVGDKFETAGENGSESYELMSSLFNPVALLLDRNNLY